MSAEAAAGPIILKPIGDETNHSKERISITISKRTADALRKMAVLKGVCQGEVMDDIVTQYFEGMMKAKDRDGL